MTDLEQLLAFAKSIGWCAAGMHDEDDGSLIGIVMGEPEFVSSVLDDLDVDLTVKLDS